MHVKGHRVCLILLKVYMDDHTLHLAYNSTENLFLWIGVAVSGTEQYCWRKALPYMGSFNLSLQNMMQCPHVVYWTSLLLASKHDNTFKDSVNTHCIMHSIGLHVLCNIISSTRIWRCNAICSE